MVRARQRPLVSPQSPPLDGKKKKKEPSDILQLSQVGRGPKRAVQLGVRLEKQAVSDKASLLGRG